MAWPFVLSVSLGVIALVLIIVLLVIGLTRKGRSCGKPTMTYPYATHRGNVKLNNPPTRKHAKRSDPLLLTETPIDIVELQHIFEVEARQRINGEAFGSPRGDMFGHWFDKLNNDLLVSSNAAMILLRKNIETQTYETIGRFRNKSPCGLMYNWDLHQWWIFEGTTLNLQIQTGTIYPIHTDVEHFDYDGPDFVVLKRNTLEFYTLLYADASEFKVEKKGESTMPDQEATCYRLFYHKGYTVLCYDDGTQFIHHHQRQLLKNHAVLRVQHVSWNDTLTLFAVQYENKVDVHDSTSAQRVHHEVFDNLVGCSAFAGDHVVVVGLPTMNEGSGGLVCFKIGYNSTVVYIGEHGSYLGSTLRISGLNNRFQILASTEKNFIEDINIRLVIQ